MGKYRRMDIKKTHDAHINGALDIVAISAILDAGRANLYGVWIGISNSFDTIEGKYVRREVSVCQTWCYNRNMLTICDSQVTIYVSSGFRNVDLWRAELKHTLSTMFNFDCDIIYKEGMTFAIDAFDRVYNITGTLKFDLDCDFKDSIKNNEITNQPIRDMVIKIHNRKPTGPREKRKHSW